MTLNFSLSFFPRPPASNHFSPSTEGLPNKTPQPMKRNGTRAGATHFKVSTIMPDSNAERQRRKRAKPGYKDRTANARARRWYNEHRRVTDKKLCSICGKPMKGRWSLQFGFHQKCDPAQYQKLWREAKKK
jgi:hypothetical protein